MKVKLAESEADIKRCFPVMVQLRPHLTSDEFTLGAKRQSQQEGYQLAYLEDANEIKAVAGFRVSEMLSRGRFLYVDDLVTDHDSRSKGYGDFLFDWLVEYAKSQNCCHLELDSGVQRVDAHRFYFRKRMQISGYHFSLKLSG